MNSDFYLILVVHKLVGVVRGFIRDKLDEGKRCLSFNQSNSTLEEE